MDSRYLQRRNNYLSAYGTLTLLGVDARRRPNRENPRRGGRRLQSYFFFAFLAPDFLLFLDDFLTADFLDESLDFLADPEPPFLDFLDF